MSWTTLTDAHIASVLSISELAQIRTALEAEDATDPVATAAARIVQRIRGDVAASGKYALSAVTTTIPDRLVDAACALLVGAFLAHPESGVIDNEAKTRADAVKSAERLLERVARGEYAIEDPDSGSDAKASPVSTVTYNERDFTRAKMKGL